MLSTLNVIKRGTRDHMCLLIEPKRKFIATQEFMHSYSEELNLNLTKTLD